MNQDRFLELLNLYLDDEISSEELSGLMAETRLDPERERVFLEYCKIHKACALIGPGLGAGRDRRSMWQTVYALGGLAAAFALLALAGRNLMPFFQESAGEPVVAQQIEAVSEQNGLVFAAFANTEVLGPRFVAMSEEPRIRVLGPSSRQIPVLSYGSLFKTKPSWVDKIPSFETGEELLGSEGIELRDPFKEFEEIGEKLNLELSSASSEINRDLLNGLELGVTLNANN